MFEHLHPSVAGLAEVSDSDLVSGIAGKARSSAIADAERLAMIAELARRRSTDESQSKSACDERDAAAAEVACALTIGHGRALGQIDLALTLRDRLPKVGRRFLAGEISAREVSAIAWRTYLVTDAQALARIDTELAENAAAWGPLSQHKLDQAIDFWVDKYDPDAVRRTRNSVRGRYFKVGDHNDDASGTVSVFGRLTVADAALFGGRLAAMIAGVCEDDPRTLNQRYADAVGAIGAGSDRLACRCDNPECEAAAFDDGRASSVVVHIVGEKDSLDEPRDPDLDGEGVERRTTPEQTPESIPRRKAAVIPAMRGSIVPAPLLAELIAHGAKIRFVGAPGEHAEDRYRPSAALQEFVRARDMTCRFPGCDRPAVYADIDHTQPWPVGVTHPANLKCYCRIHHLVKTFRDGWTDTQLPDGTLRVTTPTGHTYTTKPLSTLLFPAWNTTTPPPPSPASPSTPPMSPGRQLMMPIRRVTREKARQYRIAAERQRNAMERALEAARAGSVVESPALDRRLDYGDDPPPF